MAKGSSGLISDVLKGAMVGAAAAGVDQSEEVDNQPTARRRHRALEGNGAGLAAPHGGSAQQLSIAEAGHARHPGAPRASDSHMVLINAMCVLLPAH